MAEYDGPAVLELDDGRRWQARAQLDGFDPPFRGRLDLDHGPVDAAAEGIPREGLGVQLHLLDEPRYSLEVAIYRREQKWNGGVTLRIADTSATR
ncbi:hypothetical protein ACYSUO_18560 [Streptomyces sp. UC4497]